MEGAGASGILVNHQDSNEVCNQFHNKIEELSNYSSSVIE